MPNGFVGVDIANGDNNGIGGNVIANSGDQGVKVSQGTGNYISLNSIRNSGGQGISLGNNGTVQPNEITNDVDTGPNNFQNFPVITSVVVDGGTATIQGTLNSTPNTSFSVEAFRNSSCDGTHGEGASNTGFDSTVDMTNGLGQRLVLDYHGRGERR